MPAALSVCVSQVDRIDSAFLHTVFSWFMVCLHMCAKFMLAMFRVIQCAPGCDGFRATMFRDPVFSGKHIQCVCTVFG